MTTNIRTVVQGEALESDSDSDDAMPAPVEDDSRVPGEAPETDDEEDELTNLSWEHEESKLQLGSFPHLKVETGPGLNAAETNEKLANLQEQVKNLERDLPKYDTLLHRKLRERNIALHRDMNEVISQAFQNARKDLSSSSQQLSRTQSVIQDACHTLRIFSNDLKSMEEKLDIIKGNNNIPKLTVPLMNRQDTAKVDS
ncbi:biogenesis of lysosome-related organelles complex 1 subunit 3-like [Anneissia japonica]|uniref:biogenesis of lysosome-related organelles complex 1 subunit 3-like n=1 Tax=Anneissia japonica TaxID=1529436 RepID=UPI001425A013|nr:biogenesis of lysosome-related organelles complex 1 subunit 3-like [Anneissia japonica]XP_033106974.1 biogenesis of lysosome-related organelles complex 1 subunit 3-like [Anneissia japonica]XP_033106975.1 biogenesis of lysosome-related organelles complex 1 subunit 3-like [Anneissia japonica]XP_033106976.1 biogenesis of lysosome-related organelles complex 1 subunit 3-like [Anneissia japonica]XP_033106977.1 biogenesis of lysosome-related organelles complex 1 subunit 3-like [Anneissia japonica]